LFLFSYFDNSNKNKIIIKFLLILFVFLISIFHLITPLFDFLFNANNLIQTHRIDGSLSNEVQQTKTILDERINQLLSKSNGLLFFLNSVVRNSMFYETAFPHEGLIIKIIYFSSFASLIIAFILISIKNILIKKNILLNISFLAFSFIFISGSNNIIGELFFKIISNYLPELFIIYANPYRLIPVYLIMVLILSIFTSYRKYFEYLLIFCAIIFSINFIFFKFFKTSEDRQFIQTMKVIEKNINTNEIELLKKLEDDNDSFHIAILPHAFLSWSYDQENTISIPWNSNYFPKSNMITDRADILSRLVLDRFFSLNEQYELDFIFKLNSISYVIAPKFSNIFLYINILKNYNNNQFDFLNDYNELYKLNVRDLRKLNLDLSSEDISVYEIENTYPIIFCPTKKEILPNKLENLKEFFRTFKTNKNELYAFFNKDVSIDFCKNNDLKYSVYNKNIYNVYSSNNSNFQSLIFNKNFDHSWKIIPKENFDNYFDIFFYLILNSNSLIEINNHFEVNFNKNFWNLDNHTNKLTIFNLKELIFYFIKLTQILLVFLFLIIILYNRLKYKND